MFAQEALTLFERAGISQEVFNEKSVKSFHDLLGEVRREEAILTEAQRQGWIKRIAWSSKLIIRTESEYLGELFRIYPGTDSHVVKKCLFAGVMLTQPNWTLSETAVRGEDPLLVILRGIREELGISLSSSHSLTCLNPGNPWIDIHESSVYHRVITENHTTWFEWTMKERHGPDIVVRRDDLVELHLKWQSYNFDFYDYD